MRILFTPIGSNDPYSSRGRNQPGADMEGSALTVIREVRPHKVYLFYNANADGSVEDAARDTADVIAQESLVAAVELLPQDGFAEPNVYDAVYPLLDNELAKLRDAYPFAEIALNTSSGTPAIKAALLIIHTLDRYQTRAYQVSDRGENRVTEIEKFHSLANEITKENIKTLVVEYDYNAAQVLAKGVVSDEAMRLIDAAVERYELRSGKARRGFSERLALQLMGPTSHYGKAFEYLQYLRLLAGKEEWAAFLRATDPALVSVLLCVVDAFTEYDYHQLVGTEGSMTLNVGVVEKDSFLAKVFAREIEAEYARDCFVTWRPLRKIAVDATSGLSDTRKESLKGIDALQDCRNRFVHSIQAVDVMQAKKHAEEWLELLEGLLKDSAVEKGVALPAWDSYDKLNAAIFSTL